MPSSSSSGTRAFVPRASLAPRPLQGLESALVCGGRAGLLVPGTPAFVSPLEGFEGVTSQKRGVMASTRDQRGVQPECGMP